MYRLSPGFALALNEAIAILFFLLVSPLHIAALHLIQPVTLMTVYYQILRSSLVL